jgi:hypothetical protein
MAPKVARQRTPSPAPSTHSNDGLDWLKDNGIPPPCTPPGSPPPLIQEEFVPDDAHPTLWSGSLHMPNFAPPFSIHLRQLGGRLLGQSTTRQVSEVLPDTGQELMVEGRLPKNKAEAYLEHQIYSQTKELVVFEIFSTEQSAELHSLAKDLSNRSRLGVVRTKSFATDIVRDFYIVPLVSQGPDLLKKMQTTGWLKDWKPSKGPRCLAILVVTRPKRDSVIESATPPSMQTPIQSVPIMQPVPPPIQPVVNISDDALASLFSAIQNVQPGQPAQPVQWNPDLMGALSALGIPPPQ